MDGFVELIGSGGWGTAGAVILAVLGALLFGKLIPESQHNREIQMYKDLAAAKEDESAKLRSLAATQAEIIDKVAGPLGIVADFFKKAAEDPNEGDTGLQDAIDEMTHPGRPDPNADGTSG